MYIERHGPSREMLKFECPNKPGNFCKVLLKPWPIINANTWGWDSNREAPTLTQSINCSDCGWHGFIIKGKTVLTKDVKL